MQQNDYRDNRAYENGSAAAVGVCLQGYLPVVAATAKRVGK